MGLSRWVPRFRGTQRAFSFEASRRGKRPRRDRNDRGFSLVEIVVSIFILAILSLAFLPPLVQAIKQSASNAILVSATHLASAQIDSVRQQAPSCSALTNYVASASHDVIYSSTVTLHVVVSMDTCPAAYPAAVGLTVVVTSTAPTTTTLVSAKTLVYLQNAS